MGGVTCGCYPNPQEQGPNFDITVKLRSVESKLDSAGSQETVDPIEKICESLLVYQACKAASALLYLRVETRISELLSVEARRSWAAVGDFRKLERLKARLIQYSANSMYFGCVNPLQRPEGLGVKLLEDGRLMEGEWKDGQLEPKGRVVFPSGCYYEGDLKNGEMEGTGVYVNLNVLTYRGQWKAGKQHGRGLEQYDAKSYFEGSFVAGLKQGKGKFVWANGCSYTGNFKNNLLDGLGTYTWADKHIYEGEWKDNKMHGRGRLVWPNGSSYDGEFKADMKDGYGKFRWEDGRVFEGTWVRNKMHGEGFMTYPKDGQKKGQWSNGTLVGWL